MTIAGLAILTALAWGYLFAGAGVSAMPGMSSPGFATVVIMWWVMMVAMMIPAASPAILLYAHVHRHSKGLQSTPPTVAFLAGYLASWFAFALVFGGLQFWLPSSMSMALANRNAVAGLLIAAGVYQLTPFKSACLSRCRSPALFLTRHYRPGQLGALRLGIWHGVYCIGCCWLLMGLLFVGGVMNLIWVVGLTLLVAAEKLLPGGLWLARVAGVVMGLWGAALLFA